MPRILLVIVLYKQRVYDCKSYKTLLPALTAQHGIYLFDNSPTPQHTAAEFAQEAIHYVSACTNPGLSYAYNQAAAYAQEHHYDWMLILDQDTTFPSDMLQRYQAAMADHPHIKLFVPKVVTGRGGVLSPGKLNLIFNMTGFDGESMELPSRYYTAINSGMLVYTAALLDVGGYNERVWLDFSDHQFMERFSQRYDTFYLMDTTILQEFSGEVDSAEQRLTRFKNYCNSLAAIPKGSLKRQLCYLLLILKQVARLTLKLRSIEPLTIALKGYFLKQGMRK